MLQMVHLLHPVDLFANFRGVHSIFRTSDF